MKYEFMATGRIFLPLFAALIIISVVNGLLSYLPIQTPQIIGGAVAIMLIVGIIVLSFVITLQRFRNNLMSSEGYLMMTLPVKTDSIILSKMFTASIWNVASVIVVAISIMTMMMPSVSLPDLISHIRAALERVSLLNFVLYLVEILVLIALSLFSGILMFYACMSLSMLVNKHRGLFTFGAYIVISTVLQIISSVIVAIMVALDMAEIFSFDKFFSSLNTHILLLIIIVIGTALCAVFYFITRYMLKRKLNLQ
jgi:hypothetical protein